jgi:hypothetical protein
MIKVGVSNYNIFIIQQRNTTTIKILFNKHVAIKLLCQLLIILWYYKMLPDKVVHLLKYTVTKYPKIKTNFMCKVIIYKTPQNNVYLRLKRMVLNLKDILFIAQQLIYSLAFEFQIYTEKQVAVVLKPTFKTHQFSTTHQDWATFFTMNHLCKIFNNDHLFDDLLVQ